MTDLTETPAHPIAIRLARIRDRVRTASMRAGRSEDDVTIVAVSKQQPIESIQAAYHAGQRHFGESYVQEALPKLATLHDCPAAEWHFIGRVQANKTRAIAEHFRWIHTVDREKIALRLAAHRPLFAPPLNVLIQVSLAGEPQKGGIEPEAVRSLADAIRKQPRLALRGLMTMPPADESMEAARVCFERLRLLSETLVAEGYPLVTLSMGMSQDFELAIGCGSHCVRIGTAIFGARD